MFIVDTVEVGNKLNMKWVIWIIETYILDVLLLSVALIGIEQLIRHG